MESAVTKIFENGSYLLLVTMLAGSLFFAMAGVRELRDERLEGLLYWALAVFFFAAHLLMLWNLPEQSSLGRLAGRLDMWNWLVWLYAPGLIGMFLLRGVVSFFCSQVRPGLFKLFFGLTLLCYLYMVGQDWPADVKGILTFIWAIVFVHLEVRTDYAEVRARYSSRR